MLCSMYRYVLVLFIVIVSNCRFTVQNEEVEILEIVPQNEEQLEQMRLFTGDGRFDFWSPLKIATPCNVMMQKNDTNDFVKLIRGIPRKIRTEDILKETAAFMEKVRDQKPFQMGMSTKSFLLSQYHRHEEIGKPSTSVKPSLWIDGGSRGREWIGPAVALFIMNQLVEKYSSDPGVKNLVDAVDFYIVPVANPDGYSYTWTGYGPSNRLWAKTRSNWDCSLWRCCYGTDLDRNWDLEWNVTGSSSNPCDNQYAGPSAFSEPESKAMSQKLTQLKANNNLMAYISLGAYGQQWLLPYGYQKNAFPLNYKQMHDLALSSEAALQKVHKRYYAVANSADMQGEISGSAIDWVAGKLKISYAYSIRLRPVTSPRYPYILASSEIVPNGEETLEGIKSIARSISTL